MGSFSIWHWLIVLLVVVLIFGTKKLKNIGSDLGSAVKGFKQGMKDGGADEPVPPSQQVTADKKTDANTVDVDGKLEVLRDKEMVTSAGGYVEYQRKGSSSSEFKGKNGAAGLFLEVSGSPTIYRLLDQRGWTFEFFGFDTGVAGANGLLWRAVNPDSGTPARAYIGDATSASTAVSTGFSGGHLVYAFDSADRRFTYTWNSDPTPHISQVKVETKTGGGWFSSPTGVTEVGKVDYTYYGDESFGDADKFMN